MYRLLVCMCWQEGRRQRYALSGGNLFCDSERLAWCLGDFLSFSRCVGDGAACLRVRVVKGGIWPSPHHFTVYTACRTLHKQLMLQSAPCSGAVRTSHDCNCMEPADLPPGSACKLLWAPFQSCRGLCAKKPPHLKAVTKGPAFLLWRCVELRLCCCAQGLAGGGDQLYG